MKHPVPTALLAFVIGLAVGWFLKPAGAPRKALPTATLSPHDPAPPSAPGDETSPEGSEPLAERRQATERVLEARLANLHPLRLTPAQEQELREQFIAPRLQLQQLESDPDRSATQDDGPDLQSLGAVLGRILNDEQATIYEELAAHQRRVILETSTLHRLADLTYLDLSLQQREAMHGILLRDAESAAPAGFVNPATGDSSEASSGEAPRLDSSGVTAGQREMIERNVNRFADILTPAQLQRYRTRLEQYHASSGLFDPTLEELPPLEKPRPTP